MRTWATVLCVLAAAGAAAGRPPAPHAVVFDNGDRLQGRLERIADGELTLAPAVADRQKLTVDLARIERIEATAAAEPNGDPADLLELWDGSMLYGRFRKITPQAVHFDIRRAGAARIPLARIAGLFRPDFTPPDTLPERRGHVLCAKKGDVLVGRIRPLGDGRIEVQGSAVKLAVAYDQIAGLYFPEQSAADAKRPAAEKPGGRLAVLSLDDGTVLSGEGLSAASGQVRLTIEKGQEVTVPLAAVREIGFVFRGAAAGRRQVLVWGAYADRSEELPRTLGVLREVLPGGWRVVENTSAAPDAAFRKALSRSRALVIAEMETWNDGAAAAVTEKLKPLALRLLWRGGNVVILGATNKQVGALREAGLVDLHQPGSVSDNSSVPFTAAGRWLARGVGDSFNASNSTMTYTLGASAATTVILARHGDGGPCVARRVGRGWVIALGMDYYASNPGVATMLRNAVMHR
jgi:hypothetical protein